MNCVGSLFRSATLLALLLAACNDSKLDGARGFIAAAPASVDFGTLPPLSRTTVKVTLLNDGRADVIIQGAELSRDARGAFKPGAMPERVPGGSSVEFEITYEAPALEGADDATLVIQSTADNAGAFAIPLVARTRAPACDDQIRNGDETDMDCGGGTCPGCPLNGVCTDAGDCDLGLGCVQELCRACESNDACREGQVCQGGVCTGCGADRDCSAGSTCVAGACVACPGATGPIDTTSDVAHCGACNNVCPVPAHASAVCVAGECGRGPCQSGWYDLDEETFGCESSCVGRVCTDEIGHTIEVTSPPLPEQGLVQGAFASGSSFGGEVQTSAGHTNIGVLGDGTPVAPEQTSRRFRHAGGFITSQQ